MSRASVLGIAAAALAGVSCRDEAPKAPALPDTGAAAAGWRAMYDAWTYGDPIPDFPLVDHGGRAFRLGELRDAYVLVGFVFTRCPNPKACPLTMKKMKEAQDLWKAKEAAGAAGGKRLELLGLTLDPGFDGPPLLEGFAKAHGWDLATARMATGEPELMENALPALFSVLSLPSPEQILNHTVKVALLAPGLEPLEEWKDNAFEPADVVKRVLEHAPEP